LATLALSPALTRATTLISPFRIGSVGGTTLTISTFVGIFRHPLEGVSFGGTSMKIVPATGTLTKGSCKEQANSRETYSTVECVTPAHEAGHVEIDVKSGGGESFFEVLVVPEVYKNQLPVGAAHVPVLAYGQLKLETPGVVAVECVDLGFGSGWNEGKPRNEATEGRAEVLTWWAGGHAPNETYPQLSGQCRLEYRIGEGEGVQLSKIVSWVSAEPPLHTAIQEAIVCAEPTEKELSECPEESERLHEGVVRELSREAPSVPWNIQFGERSERVDAQIGLRQVCANIFNAERTELSKCPEATEQKAAYSPNECANGPAAAPPGCMRVQVLSGPPFHLHLEYEGFLEPRVINSGPNGLSPSSWEFEGSGGGEPTLRLAEQTSQRGSVTGSLKLLGYAGQELLTAR
jgi:hypothetical protein